MEPTQEQIDNLRKAFLEQVATKDKNCIHEKDLKRVEKDDAWLVRFLKHNELKQEDALEMMWKCVTWRKEFNTNDVHKNARPDMLGLGNLFLRGKDKDGSLIYVFKCKGHIKGAYPTEEVKKCNVYWMERAEREGNGQPITIFFDLEGSGLSNMDMEITKYIISLFKDYYPYFLNYIIIYEMPWVLSAAFKIIKSWLPEKAVQKIKFVSKKDVKDWVPLDQALKCWGGQDDYVFSLVPEEFESERPTEIENLTPNNNNRKVHFMDGSPMSESGVSDKEENGGLTVQPYNIIKFVKEGNELISTIELQNNGTTNLSYKLKTTSPEKFRVRPGAGCLIPGARATITVTLLQGFQLGGLSKDKFLVISLPIEEAELSTQELAALWKNIQGKKVYQHHLRCAQVGDATKNGSALGAGGMSLDSDPNQAFNKLSASVVDLAKCQNQLHQSLKQTQYFQIATLVLILVLGVILSYALQANNQVSSCSAPKSEL